MFCYISYKIFTLISYITYLIFSINILDYINLCFNIYSKMNCKLNLKSLFWKLKIKFIGEKVLFDKYYNLREIKKINENDNTIEKNILVKQINNFIKINLNNEIKDVIVSLSGGVDSMVILFILIFLRNKLENKKKFNIYTASIDYGTRSESKYETLYLKKYCEYFNVEFNCVTVSHVERKTGQNTRNEYEEESQKIRFDLYNQIIGNINIKNNNEEKVGIFLGHHKDDLVENIFNNIIKGRSINDLEVMEEISKKKNIIFYRPLLEYYKEEIYNFSNKYKVPYFRDTTPKWSKRGLLRNEIFPLIERVYGPSWKINYNKLGLQSRNLKNEINNKLEDLINNTKIKEDRIYINHDILIELIGTKRKKSIINISLQENLIFREYVRHIFHNVFGKSSPRESIFSKIKIKEKEFYLDLVNTNQEKIFLIINSNIFSIINNKLIEKINIMTPNIKKIETQNNHMSSNFKNFLEGNINYYIKQECKEFKKILNKNNKKFTTLIDLPINIKGKLYLYVKNNEDKLNQEIEYKF